MIKAVWVKRIVSADGRKYTRRIIMAIQER